MTDTKKALEMAIEQIKWAKHLHDWHDGLLDALKACKEALEQKEQADIQRMGIAGAVEQLYLQSLEQPSWQGLSDDEIEEITCKVRADRLMTNKPTWHIRIARAIEQALRIKNART